MKNNMIACLISINDLHPNLIFYVWLMIFLMLLPPVCVFVAFNEVVEGEVKARKILHVECGGKKIKTFIAKPRGARVSTSSQLLREIK